MKKNKNFDLQTEVDEIKNILNSSKKMRAKYQKAAEDCFDFAIGQVLASILETHRQLRRVNFTVTEKVIHEILDETLDEKPKRRVKSKR